MSTSLNKHILIRSTRIFKNKTAGLCEALLSLRVDLEVELGSHLVWLSLSRNCGPKLGI